MAKTKETKPADKSSVNDLYSQVKFLPDKPLTADYEQNDRFGHSGIAENLNQIVLTCPVPFTIGLFGKWGTGKTTVLNILKDRLRTQKVPVVTFDVWKHEGDALRRTFLKEIVKQLKTQRLLKDFKLSEQVDSSIGIKKTFETLNIFNCAVTYIFLGLMILLGFIFYLTDIPTFKGYLSIVTSSSLVAGLIIVLIQRMIVTEDITKTTNRFEDPHEFEREFFRIIKETHAPRLLIAVDNLDRCTHENAVKLLTTIKTFLAKDSDTEANNKCIFLITCDDKAIGKHLRRIYNHNGQESYDVDEFLRKFFNAFLVLPNFIHTELQSYTEDLLKETKIPKFDDADVAHVITAPFRDNPRQIKQFINILIAHFLMAQNREVGSHPMIVPKGIITGNVAFLAKFLVIRQKFSLAHKAITDDYLPFKEWDKIEINGADLADFKNFLNSTKTISTDNIEPFIHLKQSPEELNIQGYREIKLALTDNNPKVVKEKMERFEATPSKIGHFNRFLLELIERSKQRKAILLNVTSCFLEAFDHSKLNLGGHLYVRIGSIVNDETKGLKKNLPEFNPEIIFAELLPKCNENDRSGIIDGYISYFSEQTNIQGEPVTKDPSGTVIDSTIERSHACKLLKEFVRHKEWLSEKAKAKINKAIEDTYYHDTEILSLFQSDLENQKDFISENTLSKFVSTFSDADVQIKKPIAEKIQLLLNFKPIIKSKATQNILNKLQELLEAENKLPLEQLEEDEIGRKQNLLRLIENILHALAEETKKEQLKTNLNPLADKLSQGANALPDWNTRKLFIFPCLLIVDLLEDPYKSKVNQLMQNFFANANLNSLHFIFENKKLPKNKQPELIATYPQVFKQRAINDQSIFDYLYPIASKQNRLEWLVYLINSDHNRAVQKLEAEGYKTDDSKQIVQALLQKVTTVAAPEKYAIYHTVSKMKCANDKMLKSTLVAQIKPLLKTTDPQNQKVGYHALERAHSFLSGPNKRDIATEVIEWLRNLEPASAGQVHSVGSIFLVWNDLANTPRQGDYIDFISDKLIVRGTSLDGVKLGIQTLIKVKPTYENYSKQYDDIFNRFETELDQNIKIVINGGLVNLKPEKTNKENKAFWAKIQKWDLDDDGE